jgi:hypothetical protein
MTDGRNMIEDKQPNLNQVRLALNRLLESMYILIENGLESKYHEDWWCVGVMQCGLFENDMRAMPAKGEREELLSSIDAKRGLTIIINRYVDLGLSNDAKRWAIDLKKDCRNVLNHFGAIKDLNSDEAWRMVYDMERFSRLFDEDCADDLKELLKELRNENEDERPEWNIDGTNIQKGQVTLVGEIADSSKSEKKKKSSMKSQRLVDGVPRIDVFKNHPK